MSRVVFAVTMIGLGALGLITGDFTPLWTGVPKSVPVREALAYICAFIALLSGVGLFWKGTAFVASRILLAFFLGWLLLVRTRYIFIAPAAIDTWWALGQTAVMLAAAWILYVSSDRDRHGEHRGFASGGNGLRIATAFYGLGLIPFGVAHFMYLDRTASMVPGWLPSHRAWAYFTGSAFIVAGVAVLIDVYARLAATLSAWQMGLFTLLVWGPILAAGHPSASDWTEVVVSWALTAAAWVVASSYRGVPWHARHRVRAGASAIS